jgi:uncharacterized protein with PQ loop repeat
VERKAVKSNPILYDFITQADNKSAYKYCLKMELELLLHIVSTLGIVLSIGLSFSPVPAVYRAWNTKGLEEISYSFLMISHMNAFVWTLYAVKIHSIEIFIPNIVGSIISFATLIAYHKISESLCRFLVKYAILEITGMVLILRFVTPNDVGIMSVVMSAALYLSSFE